MYNIVLCTFGIAWLHFMSEFFVFRTAKITGPFLAPCVVASKSLCYLFFLLNRNVFRFGKFFSDRSNVTSLPLASSLIWMVSQYGHYVKQY